MPKIYKPHSRHLPKGLEIIFEDDDLLVVNKAAGLLTMGTDSEKSKTAYFMLTDYVRKGNQKSRKRLFIVHRLDRDTSGLLVFAKNFAAKERLQKQWDETQKKYLAVVHGKCQKKTDVITSYLAENKIHQVYSTEDTEEGKLAKTAYKLIKTAKNYSLLEIELLTGRKHQIRVHMADIGHPVVGDKKYGQEKGPSRRLALHASSISFKHPVSGEVCNFKAASPIYFDELIGQDKTGK